MHGLRRKGWATEMRARVAAIVCVLALIAYWAVGGVLGGAVGDFVDASLPWLALGVGVALLVALDRRGG